MEKSDRTYDTEKSRWKERPKKLQTNIFNKLFSTIGRKIYLLEINKHLVENKIIIKQQSGFRSFRQTKDNILCICQRNMEAINKK